MENNWIKELKIGDKVFVDKLTNRTLNPNIKPTLEWFLGTVDHITPKGRIRVVHPRIKNHKILFDLNGQERVNTNNRSGMGYTRFSLTRYNVETLYNRQAEVEKQLIIDKIKKFDYSQLSLNQLKEINDIISRGAENE